MDAAIFISIAGIILLLGIYFGIKGFKAAAEDKNVVYISDFEEIRELNKGKVSKINPVDISDSLTQHMINENIAGKENLRPESEDQNNQQVMKDDIDLIRRENERRSVEINEKLEVLTRENLQLKQDLQQTLDAKNKADTEKDSVNREQFLLAQEEIAKLGQDNDALRAAVGHQRESYEELLGKFKQVEIEREKEKVDQEKMSALQEEVAKAKVDIENLINGRSVISELKDENQLLIKQIKLSELRTKELRSELEIVQKDQNEKLLNAQETIKKLEESQRQSSYIQNEVLGKELQQAKESMEYMVKERDALRYTMNSLQEQVEISKELNAHLLEKEVLLEYELSKSRAQALGLERICEDFKVQIEDADQHLVR